MFLESITIGNFRSFANEQTFEFPTTPGLYFMQGINEVEPRLGANGAGKSTIWDALTWCLFGKTPRGLKAGDVCNWEAGKGTKVVLVFSDGAGVEYAVTRTWGPISWKLRSRDVTGEHGDFDDEIDLAKDPGNPVLGLLRLDFTPFLNSILTAQDQPMFLDQKAEPQAALFSDVMGLDRWLGYAGVASTKASAQDSISRVLERKLAGLRGQLESLSASDLKLSVNEWEEARKDRLDQLEAKYEQALAKAKHIKEPLAGLLEQEQNQRAFMATLAGPLGDKQDHVKSLSGELHDRKMLLAGDEKEMEHAQKQLDHLIKEDHCPTCHQRIPRSEQEAHLRAASSQYEKAKAKADKERKRIKSLTADVGELEKEIQGLADQTQEAQFRLDDLVGRINGVRRDLANQDRELDRMEEQAEEISKEKNPYLEMQEKALRDGERLRNEIHDTQRLLDDSNSRYSILSYWVRGFKELRLQLIAEALNELEIEVNSCVAALGLVGWELNFQVDRETKKGNIQRGFSVLVKSPHNQLAVPWEAWSGGEAQRLRLACNMGLADLIRSRSGSTLNLEVWDEPTKGLSAQGAQDLLESLATRARTEGRPIWLVDHRTHAFGGFSGGITIVKTKAGSQLI